MPLICLNTDIIIPCLLPHSHSQVYNELKALNPVKACGPDGAPSLLLLKSAEHIIIISVVNSIK